MGCCRRSAIEICLVIPIPSFAAALSGVSRGTCVQSSRSIQCVDCGIGSADRTTSTIVVPPFACCAFRQCNRAARYSLARLSAVDSTVLSGRVRLASNVQCSSAARSVGCRAGFVT